MKKLLLILLTALLMLPAAMRAQETLTVADGTTTNSYVPVYGLYCDAYLKCEYVFPASDLSDMAGSSISGMTFYLSTSASDSWGEANFQVFLAEVPSTSISSYYGLANATVVYTGSLDGTGTTMEVEFDEPYEYDGGNLLVGFYNTVNGTFKSASFYGVASSGSCVQGYDGSSLSAVTPTQRNFLPKTTFTYEMASLTCPGPKNPVVSEINDNSATFSWTNNGDAAAWDIYYTTSTVAPDSLTEPLETVNDTLTSLSDLTSSTKYYVYVRTNCGDEGVSKWKGTSFMTLQVAATLPYIQDFEEMEENGQWVYENGTFTNKWCIGAAANNTEGGSKSLYVSNDNGVTNHYNNSSESKVWAYRDIDFSNYAEYTLSFDFKCGGESTYDYLNVYLGRPAAPAGSAAPQGATCLLEKANQTNNAWISKEFELNSSFQGVQRLYFYWRNDGSDGTNPAATIDNLHITGYACGRPAAVTTSNITSESVTLHILPALESDNAWDVVVMPHDSLVDEDLAVSATDTLFILEGLSDNTTYDLYVRTNCVDAVSAWVMAGTITTKCLTNSEIPYVENFQSYGCGNASNFPDCWIRHQHGTTTQYPYIKAIGGDTSLYFYSSSIAYVYAATQCLDLSAQTPGALALYFDTYKTSASYGRMDIGFMTDADDINTFHLIKSIYPNDFATPSFWYKNNMIVLPEDAYQPNVYLAFWAVDGASNEFYIDNVKVDNVEDVCYAPTTLSVSNIMGASALISWTSLNEEQNFILEYSVQGGDEWTSVTVEGNNNYMLSGLTAQTEYAVRVYAECGSDTVATTFATPCSAGGDVVFDQGTTGFSYLPLANYFNYAYTQQIFLASEMNGPATIESVSFDYATSTPTTKKNSVKIYLGHTNKSSFSSISDYVAASDLVEVYSGNLNCTQGWNTFTLSTPFDYDGTNNLVIAVDDNSGQYQSSGLNFRVQTMSDYKSIYFYHDASDISMTNPSATSQNISTNRNNIKFGASCDTTATCFRPNMRVVDLDESSITIDWVAGGEESSWELQYKFEEDSVWDDYSEILTESQSPYPILGLSSNASYTIRLRSVCGDDTYSEWTVTTAKTTCEDVMELPYDEDFEDAGTGSDPFVDCWTRGTNSTSHQYPYCSTNNNHTDGGALALYFSGSSSNYCYAATPRLNDNIEMNNLQISFYAKPTASADFIEVGIMSDPNNYATFEKIATVTPGEQIFKLVEINTDEYAGNGRYVAFRIPQWKTSAMYIDDVHINYIPMCMHVNNLQLDNVTESSLTFSWTAGDEEQSAWDVVVTPTVPDINPDDYMPEPVDDITYTAEGLEDATYYSIFVRANCGDDQSEWMRIQAKTYPTPASLPYECDFEDEEEANAWDFVNTTTVNKWCVGTATSNGGTQSMYISNDNGVSNAYTSSSNVVWAYRDIVLPVSENGYMLSFDWKAKGEGNYDYMKVYMGAPAEPQASTSSTITVPTGATELPGLSKFNQNENFTTFTVELPSVASESVQRIYFCWRNDGTVNNNPPAAVDNIFMDVIACPAPTNVHIAAVTSTSADVAWTGGSATQWEVVYGEANFDPETAEPEPTSTPSYPITDLTSGTAYDVYVRTVCEEGSASFWVGPAQFVAGLYAMPSSGVDTVSMCGGFIVDPGGISGSYSANTNSTVVVLPDAEGVLVQVQGTYDLEGGYDYIKIYDGIDTNGTMLWQSSMDYDIDADSIPLTISTVGALTIYFHSDVSTQGTGFVMEVSCETPVTCDAPTNLQVGNITTNSAVASWNAGGSGETSWKVGYKLQSADQWQEATVSTTTYNIEGLTANSTYDFRVKAICSDDNQSDFVTTTFTTDPEVGIDNVELANSVTLMPNPADNYIEMTVNGNVNVKEAVIYNAFGQMIQMVQLTDNHARINLDNYASGMYFVRVSGDNAVATKKFIKK